MGFVFDCFVLKNDKLGRSPSSGELDSASDVFSERYERRARVQGSG
jgi:hypothetical protein